MFGNQNSKSLKKTITQNCPVKHVSVKLLKYQQKLLQNKILSYSIKINELHGMSRRKINHIFTWVFSNLKLLEFLNCFYCIH